MTDDRAAMRAPDRAHRELFDEVHPAALEAERLLDRGIPWEDTRARLLRTSLDHQHTQRGILHRRQLQRGSR